MKALISVSDKSRVEWLAQSLSTLGVNIISTGGTAEVIEKAGVPVLDVANVTGYPAMLDDRVKTLHPAVHGGLLARRDLPKHMKEISDHGIAPIDILVVNFYPFESTVAEPGCTLEKAIENIDIGGPAMVRSGAKNWKDVAVLTDPSQYGKVLIELDAFGAVSMRTKFEFACAAFRRVAEYDAAINDYLSGLSPAQVDEIVAE